MVSFVLFLVCLSVYLKFPMNSCACVCVCVCVWVGGGGGIVCI